MKVYDLVFLIGQLTYWEGGVVTIYPPGTIATLVEYKCNPLLEMQDGNLVSCTINQMDFYCR